MALNSGMAVRVAVIDPDFVSRERARDAVRRLGHACLALVSIDEVVALGVGARRFHWVLLACDDNDEAALRQIDQLRAVCGPRIPVLLVAQRARHAAINTALRHAERVEVIDAALPPDEQLALAQAFDQRHGGNMPAAAGMRYGAYRFVVASREVWRHEQSVALPRTEFQLALAVFAQENQTLSHEWLIDAVWGRGVPVAPRTLYTHVSALRRMLQLDGSAGYLLETVYGNGYRLKRGS